MQENLTYVAEIMRKLWFCTIIKIPPLKSDLQSKRFCVTAVSYLLIRDEQDILLNLGLDIIRPLLKIYVTQNFQSPRYSYELESSIKYTYR